MRKPFVGWYEYDLDIEYHSNCFIINVHALEEKPYRANQRVPSTREAERNQEHKDKSNFNQPWNRSQAKRNSVNIEHKIDLLQKNELNMHVLSFQLIFIEIKLNACCLHTTYPLLLPNDLLFD